jgi:cell division protein FtsI/penicillin-binding protein 2
MGAPGFVPVAHTDFVFAALTEEWGLAGGLAMIALYIVLVSRGMRAAAGSRDRFTSLLSAGITLAFGLQAILILGGVLRLLPLTGVTLPFVSYGGSSLVTSFVGIGLLVLLSSQASSGSSYRRPIRAVQTWLILAWIGLALSLGWWTVVRASVLTARSDNPRRGLAEFYSLRGAVVDREGEILAHSVGERGEYARSYPQPSAYSLVGFDSFRYGQAGVEEAADAALRGEAGQDPWILWWSHLLTGTPPPGMDIRLTISLDLQDVAAQALGDLRGAIVALETATGDVTAIASSPTYDSNRIEEDWSALVNRPDAPLINRATQGRYQPGGALAPFVLAWAIREDLAAPSDAAPSMSAPLTFDGRSLTCVRIPDIATTDFMDALAHGCPSPFAELGHRIGPIRLAEMLEAFGLTRDPGLGLHAASPYTMPEGEDPRLAAAGQGSLTVSPTQLARAFAALVDGGFLPPVRLLDAERLPGGVWDEIPSEEPSSAALSFDGAEAVADSLPLLEDGARGLVARAAVGEPGDFVAWFLGYHSGRVVVVVLEDASPDEAQETGMAVLLARNPFP